MKMLFSSMIVAALALGMTPAKSDVAWQAFECELVEEQSMDDVVAAAEKWLAAARTMKGGEGMQARILIPHAAASGTTDFVFVMRTASFTDWGMFWDNYEGSAAHMVDEESDALTVCPSSHLFEVVMVGEE